VEYHPTQNIQRGRELVLAKMCTEALAHKGHPGSYFLVGSGG